MIRPCWTIPVTPGQDEYVLTVTVPEVRPGVVVSVVITALDDATVLFESDPITVVTTSAGASAPPTPTPVPLKIVND